MFALFQHDFIQNAFLVGTIVAIVTAIIGYFVVIRNEAFAGHALSHVGFAGATGAAVIGVSALLGTFAFTLLAALGIGALGRRAQGRDVEIGMVLSFALGLGVLFLSLYTNFATETVGVLFGSIFSVSHSDVVIMLYSSVAVLLLLAIIFRPLLFLSIDPEVAQARGLPIRLVSMIFLLLLAFTIAEAVQVVGVLLVFALLIAPAATAARITSQPLLTIGLSIILGLIFTWAGLFLAVMGNWPVSFYIASFAAVAYFLSLIISRKRIQKRAQVQIRESSRQCTHALTEVK
jgi:zinc/manganese transport system permease protein